MAEFSERIASLSPKRLALLAMELQARVDAAERQDPIAVVGMACRFPGGANDPAAFWRLLRDGVDAIGEVPRDRWDVDALYDPDPDAPGKVSTRWGGFLRHPVDRFDARFFGIAPREALSMDPQHRLLLEVAWEALEHAGRAPAELAGSRTGVFVGMCSTDYHAGLWATGDRTQLDTYQATGSARSVASGRISYLLGLQGPSLSVDTACSSSLVAVHLACLSLRAGECRTALAGGVNLMLTPDISIMLSRARMMAADGRCKAFDAAADGFVRGEGCGVVVLKRLADAVADGDTVLAVVLGSAVNQDGRSSGLTAPNGPAQEAVIRDALARARVEPHEVGYVESHGTGTVLGDPIEVRALASVLGHGRPAADRVAIGSTKTNIGHLEAAAGVAGLIKAVLMLQNGEIPPHLHLKTPSPHIAWDELPVRVPTERTRWEGAEPRRIAGVSSFGFSGTNAHVIVAAPPAAAAPAVSLDRPQHLLALSAQGEPALRALAARYAEHLAASPSLALADVCFTANAGRSHFEQRTTFRAADRPALQAALRDFAAGSGAPGVAAGEPEIALLFTGQGSQHHAMGRTLYESQPTFRRALDRCDEILQAHLGRSLLSVLRPGDGDADAINETAYAQPALFALEWALAELWRAWGIQPAAVLGHSIGEYVAACVAGVMRLEDALRLVAVRGRLMQGLPRTGAMAAVTADAERVAAALAGRADRLSIAAVNGPDSVVISGEREALTAVLRMLQAQGVTHQVLAVSHAFHSPLMEPILDAFEREVASVPLAPPTIPLISNVTGEAAVAGDVTTAAYWRRHVREPVRFHDGLRALQRQGCRVFLEIGPTPTLSSLGRRSLGDEAGVWLPSLRRGRDDWEQMLDSLGALYAHGAAVDWTAFDRDYHRRRVALPTYPFQRERYWMLGTGGPSATRPGTEAGRPTGHPLLGDRLRSPLVTFRRQLTADALPAGGEAGVSSGALVETMLGAVREAFPGVPPALDDLALHEPLGLDDGRARTVHTILTPGAPGTTVQVWSLDAGDDEAGQPWVLHAEGRVGDSGPGSEGERLALDDVRRRARDVQPPPAGVSGMWHAPGEALAEVVAGDDEGHVIAPAILDLCGDVVGAAVEAREPLRIVGVERLRVHAPIPGRLWIHARRAPVVSVHLYDAAGQRVASLEGLRLARADGADPVSRWLYRVQWRPSTAAPADVAPLPRPRDIADRLAPWPARLAEEHALAVYDVALPELDRLCADYVLGAFAELGWKPRAGERTSAAALQQRLGIARRHTRLLDRMLEMLREDGWLRAVGAEWEVTRVPGSVQPDARCAELLARHPSARAELAVTRRCAGRLADVLRERCDPLELLFPGGSFELAEELYRDAPAAHAFNVLLREAVRALVEVRPAGRTLRILEVGAGTGGTASRLLPILPPERTEYVFTDVSPLFVARARDTLGAFPFVRFERLDVESDPLAQGFAAHSFDVVVAANVVHATADLRQSLAHLRQLLAPGGLLLLLEATRPQRFGDLTVGLTDGWWRFTDTELRPAYALLPREQWLTLLEAAGLEDATALPATDLGVNAFAQQSLLVAREPVARPARRAGGQWLIVADRTGTGRRLGTLLSERGADRVVVAGGDASADRRVDVTRADEVRRLVAEIGANGGPALRGVVYLRGLDAACAEDDPDAAGAPQHDLCGGALHLAQALAATGLPEPPRLWLVTRGAQPVLEPSGPLAVAQTTLWGLGKVLALEHPELRAACVDLDPAAGGDDAAALLEELLRGDIEDHVSIRAGARLVARLVRGLPVAEGAALESSLRGDGTYLVTGGLGGLGLLVARHLAERGARHLVLVGRSGASPAAASAIAEIEALGVQVRVAQADVGSRRDVEALLADVGRSMPPLRGVVHSAGVLDDGVVLQQDWSRFARVLAPKVDGAWRLHVLTRDAPLDFFVLFSSGASLLGSRGQANHAAANAFLDALAHHRRAQGRPALSINWGAWAEVGSVARLELRERMAALGMGTIPPQQGLDALGRLMAQRHPQVGVLDVDWSRAMATLGTTAASGFLAEVAVRNVTAATATSRGSAMTRGAAAPVMRQRLEAAPAGQRLDLLAGFVRAEATRVLGPGSEEALDVTRPLRDVGLDSLMAVELRNALATGLSVPLPATLLFTYPTLESLVRYLAQDVLHLSPVAPAAAPPPPSAETATAAAEAALDGLSEHELAALLNARLDRLDEGGGEGRP
jgi:acyl transferase domain-containing protein/ubiquinone/menaquinone biosynthesis C-methylase UbiE